MNTLIYVVNLDVKNISSSQDSSFCFWTCKVKFIFFLSSVRLPSFNVSFTGKISLDNVFQERERLNHNIVGEEVF